MQNVKNVIYLNFVAAMALFILAGCCRNEQEFHYKIAAAAYGFIPYDTNSTFAMQHSAGAITHFNFESTYHEEFPIEGCAECCMQEYGEVYSLKFIGDSPAIAIYISLNADGIDQAHSQTSLYLGVASNASFSFDAEHDPCTVSSNQLQCLDSLNIQGHTYQHVYQMTNQLYDSAGAIVDSLWYNADDGILKFSMYNGEFWELMP